MSSAISQAAVKRSAAPHILPRIVGSPTLKSLAHRLGETRAAVAASGLWGSSVGGAVTAAVQAELRRPGRWWSAASCVDEADDLAEDMTLFHEAQSGGAACHGIGRVHWAASAKSRRPTDSSSSGDWPPEQVQRRPPAGGSHSGPDATGAGASDQLPHLMRALKAGDAMDAQKLIVWLSDHGLQPAGPG